MDWYIKSSLLINLKYRLKHLICFETSIFSSFPLMKFYLRILKKLSLQSFHLLSSFNLSCWKFPWTNEAFFLTCCPRSNPQSKIYTFLWSFLFFVSPLSYSLAPYLFLVPLLKDKHTCERYQMVIKFLASKCRNIYGCHGYPKMQGLSEISLFRCVVLLLPVVLLFLGFFAVFFCIW